MIRWTSRTKLRAITAATATSTPSTASHHMCQTSANAVAAPAMPRNGPTALFFGNSIGW